MKTFNPPLTRVIWGDVKTFEPRFGDDLQCGDVVVYERDDTGPVLGLCIGAFRNEIELRYSEEHNAHILSTAGSSDAFFLVDANTIATDEDSHWRLITSIDDFDATFGPREDSLGLLLRDRCSAPRNVREKPQRDSKPLQLDAEGQPYFLKTPVPIQSLNGPQLDMFREPLGSHKKAGSFASVRLASSKGEPATQLGILVGDINLMLKVYGGGTGHPYIETSMGNPALYCFEENRVVLGCESWWGLISAPDKMRTITDSDIESAWYMRALRELEQAEVDKDSAPEL